MRISLIPKTTLVGLAFIFAATTLPLSAGNDARNYVKEALLSLKVRTKLLNHMHSGAVPIKVSTEKQTITLSGEVYSKSDRELANSVAESVSGVKHVKNDITVLKGEGSDQSKAARNGNEFKDALLEARIKSRLIKAGGTSAMSLEVESTNGVVSLSGSPSDKNHHDKALRITRATKGVITVHDLMKTEASEAASN